jgi:hypothetical protein
MCFIASAQKYVPSVGPGSVLNFNVTALASGQQIPLTVTVIAIKDPLKLKWTVPGYGSGVFLINSKALQTGTKMRLEQPDPDGTTVYKDDETVIVTSASILSNLLKNQSFMMNGATFTVKDTGTPYTINNKEADVIHVVSNKGKTELWILNNPDFPLICKIANNPSGIDYDLSTLKE